MLQSFNGMWIVWRWRVWRHWGGSAGLGTPVVSGAPNVTYRTTGWLTICAVVVAAVAGAGGEIAIWTVACCVITPSVEIVIVLPTASNASGCSVGSDMRHTTRAWNQLMLLILVFVSWNHTNFGQYIRVSSMGCYTNPVNAKILAAISV